MKTSTTTVQINFRVDDAIKRKADIILNGTRIHREQARRAKRD